MAAKKVNMKEKPDIYFNPDPADLAMEYISPRGTKVLIYRTMCKNETPEEHEARRLECERIVNRALYRQMMAEETEPTA